MLSGRNALIRDPSSGHVTVDFVELFFDLVYVFAVTQLSHFLIAHLGPAGVLEAVILTLAIWWAWTFTTWATNWLDPGRIPVRLLIFAIMLASLVMSASIPQAFGARGLWFALAYVAIQLGRTAFISWVMWRARPVLGLSLLRVAAWFAASAPFWILGGLADAEARLWWWGAALGIEYLGPVLQFTVPGLGHSRTIDYGVSGAHMAERCALFIIVALGEGILVTGATFSESEWSDASIAAALIAFLGSVAMWWVYFDVGMRRGAQKIESVEDTGRVARDAYTYSHLPIVAGIIVVAVADDMLMRDEPHHHYVAFLWAMIGGTMLFLGGAMLFKRLTSGARFWPLSHIVGMLLLLLVAMTCVTVRAPALAVGGMTVAVLLIVAVWEWGSFHGGWVERGVRTPRFLERYVRWRQKRMGEVEMPVSPRDDQG